MSLFEPAVAAATLSSSPDTPTRPPVGDETAVNHPRLDEIRAAARALHGRILPTPVWRWRTGVMTDDDWPHGTEVWLKLELWQRTGSFKLRGALCNLDALDAAARHRGVVAASAGNHAMTVAHAARVAGVSAIVCMPASASPARIAACEADGAEVRLAEDMHAAFALAQGLVDQQGRTMIHPFDGHRTALGTATLGLELMEQVPGLDAVVVPIGGGGLIGGVAAAVKQLQPACSVYGVEPVGADVMSRSFESGAPARLPRVESVADSLGAPHALPYSYGVCRRFVDRIVRVDDEALCEALFHLQADMKLAVEPAAAAATAALLGPLREELGGRRVALVVCGANLDATRYAQLLLRGAEVVQRRRGVGGVKGRPSR